MDVEYITPTRVELVRNPSAQYSSLRGPVLIFKQCCLGIAEIDFLEGSSEVVGSVVVDGVIVHAKFRLVDIVGLRVSDYKALGVTREFLAQALVR